MRNVLCYTRKPVNEKIYDPRLAYSMHLAIEKEGKYVPLNHNSGALFALATENEDGSLNPKSIRHPFVFNMKDGSFGVIAVRIEGDGEDDSQSKGKAIFFVSKDLVNYEEEGLIGLTDDYLERVVCIYDADACEYVIEYKDVNAKFGRVALKDIRGGEDYSDAVTGIDEGEFILPAVSEVSEDDILGVVPENEFEVDNETGKRLEDKFMVPCHIANEYPVSVTAANKEELDAIKAKAIYSDGTFAMKRVDWDVTNVDWNKEEEYEITGKIHQDVFKFPIAYNRADPCMAMWKGKYYFISTNDADHEHTIYIREADSIPELVTAEDHLILDAYTYEHVGNLLWAPELHVVEGRLYIFHACTPGEFFCEESHVMALKEGGNPVNKEDWSEPKRVVKADGSDICKQGEVITLDMTCFKWEGEYYAVWSQRQFLPKDLGAWLYIAKLNKDEPWKLASEPVVLSKPDYGWANNHTFVDEGPFAIIKDDMLILTFSSAAVDTSYVVGMLTVEKGKDILVRENWRKSNAPILTSRSVEGEFGTGHNAYVIDEYGDMWNTYHARPGVDGPRSSGVRRVHFDIDGLPRLDLVEENDVNKELRTIRTTLVVEK